MKRRSLGLVLSLALALLLGVGSLAGSTVAWFTDSITSLNSIQSGTLDVEMNYRAPGETEWKPVDLSTPLIDQSKLHVPGSVEVVFLQAENAGSLALKYQLGVTAKDTVVGTSVQGNEIRLTNYLEAGAWVVDGVTVTETDFATREAVLEMIAQPGAMQKLKDFETVQLSDSTAVEKESPAAILLTDRELKAAPAADAPDTGDAANTETIALVLHLPIDVDNVANYRGDARPKVAIGVHLLAGQQVREEDSFDAEYDKDSIYPEYRSPVTLLNEAAQAGAAVTAADQPGAADAASQADAQKDLAEPASESADEPAGDENPAESIGE